MRHWPAIEYQTLVCNALIVTICFYLLPISLKNWLFSEFEGRRVFVMVLVSWMISDVISTNLLGHDPDGALLHPLTFSGLITLEAVFAFIFFPLLGQAIANHRRPQLQEYLTSDTAG